MLRLKIDKKKSAINEKKKVFILGDSMVKCIQGWKMAKKNLKISRMFMKGIFLD